MSDLVKNPDGTVKSGGPSYPNPLSSPPRWCSWDLFRSFKVCWDAEERVGCGKQRKATAPTQSLVKLLLCFLSLRWRICLWQNCNLGSSSCSEGPALGHNPLMIYIYIYIDRPFGIVVSMFDCYPSGPGFDPRLYPRNFFVYIYIGSGTVST